MADDRKVVTGIVRFSYAFVHEPVQMQNGKMKYSVNLLIPKNDTQTLARIQAAITATETMAMAGDWGGRKPQVYKNPVLHDGDAPHPETGVVDPVAAGHYFLRARSDNKPGLVDINLNPIIEKEDFYSGCYGRASVTFFPYNTEGTKGISCGLNNLQKTHDGERLAGGASAEEDFGGENALAPGVVQPAAAADDMM